MVNGIAEERLVIKPSVGECELSVSVEEEGRTLEWRNEKSSRQVSHVAGCKARRKRYNIKGVVYKGREREAVTSCLQVHNRLALTISNPLHVASAWTHTLRLQHAALQAASVASALAKMIDVATFCCLLFFFFFFWRENKQVEIFSLCKMLAF